MCSVDGCDRKTVARGMCGKHYQTWNRLGDPTLARERRDRPGRDKTAIEVFLHYGWLEDVSGCWIWSGPVTNQGYGVFKAEKAAYLAHRFSLELSDPAFKQSDFACHTCDNPPCINPEHLFPGSQKDNMSDCASKNRCSKILAKLTEGEVLEIRALGASGVTGRTLAKKYGVTFQQISRIIRRENWKVMND